MLSQEQASKAMIEIRNAYRRGLITKEEMQRELQIISKQARRKAKS